MAFIPVPNTAQVAVVQDQQGEEVINTLYFKTALTIDGNLLDQLCAGVYAYWSTNMLAIQNEFSGLSYVEARDLTVPNGALGQFGNPAINPGLIAGPASPNNVTLAISFRTGFAGRSFRGRNYWVGFGEAQTANNRVDLTLADAIQAAYDGMKGADAVAEDWRWVVVSRRFNNAPRVTGIATNVTGALIVNPVVDSQRRRLPE